MGLQKGIVESDRSSLFFEIMRLVDECPSIEYVFLENVSNITKVGLQDVINEMVKRGFNMQWMMKSAGSLGAPHVRNRWFCLASRTKNHDDLSNIVSALGDQSTDNAWGRELYPRITFKPSIKQDDTYDDLWIQRCQCLGNTVVPCVVREAFLALASGCIHWNSIYQGLKPHTVPYDVLKYPYPECGILYDKRYISLSKIDTDIKHKVTITLSHDGKTITMGNFPTPRRGITHASSLTDRSLRDLPTILVNSLEAKAYIESQGIQPSDKMHTLVIANVNYVEWMMGYPKNWTKVNKYKRSPNAIRSPPISDDVEDTPLVPTSLTTIPTQTTPRPKRYNGMHMLMREMPGKDIREVAVAWRALSPDQKAEYSKRALSI
jgi:hypothetical protein